VLGIGGGATIATSQYLAVTQQTLHHAQSGNFNHFSQHIQCFLVNFRMGDELAGDSFSCVHVGYWTDVKQKALS
jgi:hypothetical protein